MTSAIETQNLTKRFGDRLAVDHASLHIPTGAVSGFIGPNGAGKTTTMRMLLGLVRPTDGTGTVLGEPLSKPERYMNRIGAMIEGPTFYGPLSGRANLVALARLSRLPLQRVDEGLERVGLTDRGGDPFRAYSHGMKQRLGIAAALLPRPELLVLDEPTNGLDPAGIGEVRTLLRSLRDDGITVFVSSHLLGELEQICDHVVMIQSGRLMYQGTVEQLVAAQHTEVWARPEAPADAARLLAALTASGRTARLDGPWVCVVADEDCAADLYRLAVREGITLVHLSTRRQSLEQAFLAMTGTVSGDIAQGVPSGVGSAVSSGVGGNGGGR
jgi:ABC-2 type transport system ATP-binding protein